jgi:hypothetical protein
MIKRNLKEIGQRAYDHCVNVGFRGEGVTGPTPLEAHALIHTEIAEATEEVRNSKPHFYVENGKPEGEAIELADALIRICEIATNNGWDMDALVSKKMDYNETRGHKHGGKTL